MINEKKYPTAEERLTGFNHFCRSYQTCRDCPIFRGENQKAKECSIHWLAMDGDKVVKTMSNTPTTPASVASRLTDEWIETTASNFNNEGYFYIASVLRDYVRIRKTNAELRKTLKEAADWTCGNPDEECRDCMCHGGDTPCISESWYKVLEEAEKGEAK